MSDEEISLSPILETDLEDGRQQAERRLEQAQKLLELEQIRADSTQREDLEFRDFHWQIGIRHLLVLTSLIAVSCLGFRQFGMELAIPTLVLALLGAAYFYVVDWQKEFDRGIAGREKEWRDKFES